MSDVNPFSRDFHYQNIIEDEKECDRFALYKLINEGYNYSGTLKGLMDTLNISNHYNLDRINSMYEEIDKMHKVTQ